MQENLVHSERDAQHTEQTTDQNKDVARIGVSEKIVMRHINSFLDNNLEAVLSDYTKESVLITQEETYTGIDEIRIFFSRLILHFPQQSSNMKLENMVVNDGVVFIVWNAKTPSVEVPFATDTFIMKEGKIHCQTFAGQLRFIH